MRLKKERDRTSRATREFCTAEHLAHAMGALFAAPMRQAKRVSRRSAPTSIRLRTERWCKAYVTLKLHHFPMLVLHELLQLFKRPALHVTQPQGCLLDAIAIDHNACSEMWGLDGDQAREGAHHAVLSGWTCCVRLIVNLLRD